MRIVALMAVRNEELYLERCLRHLIVQGVEVCLIDNGSTDNTRDIAQAFFGNGVSQIEDHPYPGYLDLVRILQAKERLASTIGADWFIHHDADEIREPSDSSSTLHRAVCDADAAGSAQCMEENGFESRLEGESRAPSAISGKKNLAGATCVTSLYFFKRRSRPTEIWGTGLLQI
jgi:glycosyltransferase involved in cell wall biosynthesis